jgi:hypothetical protein
MRLAARFLVAFFLSAGISCARPPSGGPLPGLVQSQVASIEITNAAGAVVRLTRPQDIRFVLGHFTQTEPHREGKVNSEFWVVVQPVSGAPITLRLEKRCVGPAVRASDVVTRWYFTSEGLYPFIQAAFARSAPKGAA